MTLGQLKTLVAIYTCPTGKALLKDIARITDSAKPTVDGRLVKLMSRGLIWASAGIPREYYVTDKGRSLVSRMAGRTAA